MSNIGVVEPFSQTIQYMFLYKQTMIMRFGETGNARIKRYREIFG